MFICHELRYMSDRIFLLFIILLFVIFFIHLSMINSVLTTDVALCFV